MRGWLRGHDVEWDELTECWRYVDDWSAASGSLAVSRDCPQCGYPPTTDGHDHCIRNVPGANGGCCGHGKHPGYVNWPGISAPPGWVRGAYVGGN